MILEVVVSTGLIININYAYFAIALKMWSHLSRAWLLNFDNKFDGQGVKIFYTHLYIEL